jgi:hypothetical protein
MLKSKVALVKLTGTESRFQVAALTSIVGANPSPNHPQAGASGPTDWGEHGTTDENTPMTTPAWADADWDMC